MIEAEQSPEVSWQQQNYASLLAEIDAVKRILRNAVSAASPGLQEVEDGSVSQSQFNQKQGTATTAQRLSATAHPRPTTARSQAPGQRARASTLTPSSVMLDRLCELFSLSLFDRQLLLLCLAVELDADVSDLCTQLTHQPCASMALALRCFEGHCAAMAADAPLSYFRFIEPRQDNLGVLRRGLVISEWALYFLTGTPQMDPAMTKSLLAIAAVEPHLPTQVGSAKALSRLLHHGEKEPSVVQLLSATQNERRHVAALCAQNENREIYELDLYKFPLRADEQNTFVRMLQREIIARQCLVLLDCQRLTSSDESNAEGRELRFCLERLIRELPNAFCLSASEQLALPQTTIFHHRIPKLSQDEQLMLWQYSLSENLNEDMQKNLVALTRQYTLDPQQVRSIACNARLEHGADTEQLQKSVWQQSRERSRQDLHGLAQVISPGDLDWDDLILAEKEKHTLQSLVSQCEQRQKVYQQWGFGRQGAYGLGICALFAGNSGTGKTMAARIIASRLNLDLYHVDLSSVVDKYIGETEKKLDKLFQAAENSGAVLLFDEADALFGKRTKVQDAKDRYANMGVSFLLQRMERYSGLSILTTNFRAAVDSAFTRRLRFIVQFSFPSAPERQKIWQRMIPADAPTENICYEKLARLVLAGGAIRNITLQAAFLAADSGKPITMECFLQAVRQEYLKAEKTLDQNLINDW